MIESLLTHKDKTMNLPFPDKSHRELSMREQVIERLLAINPGFHRRAYLETLKDFALLQALECALLVKADEGYEEHGSYMFEAGMKYQQERIIQQLSQGI